MRYKAMLLAVLTLLTVLTGAAPARATATADQWNALVWSNHHTLYCRDNITNVPTSDTIDAQVQYHHRFSPAGATHVTGAAAYSAMVADEVDVWNWNSWTGTAKQYEWGWWPAMGMSPPWSTGDMHEITPINYSLSNSYPTYGMGVLAHKRGTTRQLWCTSTWDISTTGVVS